MAKVRFIGAEPHIVPELGDRPIEPDEIVTVPDSRWEGYVCQPHLWESIEEPPPAEEEPPAEDADEKAAGEEAEPARTPPTRRAAKKAAAAKTPKGDD